jgi:hypothetical protein
MIRWFEHRQVYVPSKDHEAHPSELARPFEDVFLKAEDGLRLHAWFFPAAPGSPRAHLVLLHLHGNAGNISHRLAWYEAWLGLGVNVLAFDYRGYGRSEGKPSEHGTYLDGEAAYRWLRQKGFAAEHILALGKSLGGGVASELAVRERLGGLILQNTYTSIPDLAEELFPWLPARRLASIRYDTRVKLTRVQAPVLVAHSPEDQLIRFHHGERNFDAAKEPKMFWQLRGGHNETLEAGRAAYLEGLEKFLQRHFPDRNGHVTRLESHAANLKPKA